MTIEETTIAADDANLTTIDESSKTPAAPQEKTTVVTYTTKQFGAILDRKIKDATSKYSDYESLKEELEAIKSSKTTELPLEERYKKETASLKAKLELAMKEKLDLETNYKTEKRQSKLNAKINELASKAIKPAMVAKLIKDDIIYNDETEEFETVEIGITPEQYIANFYKENPIFLPAPIGGTGGAKQLKNNQSKIESTNKLNQYNKLSDAEIISRMKSSAFTK